MNAYALSRKPVVMTVLITCKEKQQKILEEMHECPIGGHQRVQRAYDKLKLYVTWPGMFHDVEDYISKCEMSEKQIYSFIY